MTRLSKRMAVLLALVLMAGFAAEGSVLGVEVIEEPLPMFDGRQAKLPTEGDDLPPVRAWLSRSRHWAEDGHFDVIVELGRGEADAAGTRLRCRVLGEDGAELSIFDLEPPSARFAFYPEMPAAMLGGGAGTVELAWTRGGETLGEASLPFRVERFGDTPASGRIPVRVPNEAGAAERGVPVTVGVPFPRGALRDADNLRLLDAQGEEIPLQVLETGRWSKFGTLRWVLCDYAVDLDGGSRELWLEYGPDVRRAEREGIAVRREAEGPVVETGRLRFDGALWFDANGDGNYAKVIGTDGLGAFVEHEDGRVYRAPAFAGYEIEEEGPEKVVLRREGWYEEEEGGNGQFCLYDIRWVFHRDSPLVRVFHTWTYTGDSDSDRIRNMGWRLPLAEGFRPGGFLTAFGEDGQWKPGDYLLQHDYDHYEIVSDGEVADYPEGRAPGAAMAEGDGVRLYFGARDFWQAYPSELEFADGSLWFHNWPRHGKPQPDPLVAEGDATLLKFAHTGEVLDFRLPEAYTEDPLDYSHSHGRYGSIIWQTGEPSTVNAQGIARTEEFWVYLSGAFKDANAKRVLEGLNEETLRAVVDPAWVARSGAFYEVHHQDWENYPEFEQQYEENVSHHRINRVEDVGLYGMWLYGEHLWAWHDMDALYRQLRKGHGGYGELSWMPYARSGDPVILKRRDVSTRRMIDANFCHYATEDVARKATGRGDIERLEGGFWSRGSIPWGGRGLQYLDYETQPRQWWDGWFLTGYSPARDFALMWTERVKPTLRNTAFDRGQRTIETIQKAFIDTYQNTFDPWFIVWSHKLAQVHRESWERGTWQEYGRFWSTGDREYHRFTGCEEHREYVTDFARQTAGTRVGLQSYAWRISRDEHILRRLEGLMRGFEHHGGGVGAGGRVDASSELPMVLAAFEDAGERPPGIYPSFFQRIRDYEERDDGVYVYRIPTVAVYKEEGQELPLFLGLIRLQTYQQEDDDRCYWIYGPDGQEFLAGDMSGIGTFENQPGREVVIPADAPAGVYTVEFEFRSPHDDSMRGYRNLRGIRMPVSPPGTPEVIVLEEERMGSASGGAGHFTPGYFFRVPDHVSEFEVKDIYSYNMSAAIWNPDGEKVWDDPNNRRASAVVEVPSEHRGKPWRVLGGDFIMDPSIPPYYAVDPDRWFDPEEARQR